MTTRSRAPSRAKLSTRSRRGHGSAAKGSSAARTHTQTGDSRATGKTRSSPSRSIRGAGESAGSRPPPLQAAQVDAVDAFRVEALLRRLHAPQLHRAVPGIAPRNL